MKKALCTLSLVSLLALSFLSHAQAFEVASPLPGRDFSKLRAEPAKGGSRFISALTHSGRARNLLVVEKKRKVKDIWLGFRTPWRPNKNIYWAKNTAFDLRRIKEKIIVDLSKRRLSFYSGNRKLWRSSVVVGKPSTPTPTGLFALNDFYRVGGDLRPFVFQTTAHSRVIRRWKGGEARIALHGRHGELRVPLRTARSNGCIRLPDWALYKIRKRATIGMPIIIRR